MFFVNLRPEYRANALRVAFEILGCEVKSKFEYGPDGNKYEAISFPRMYTGDEGVGDKLQALRDAGLMPDILMDAAAAMLGRGMSSCCTAFVVHPGKETAGSWADLQIEGGTGGKP